MRSVYNTQNPLQSEHSTIRESIINSICTEVPQIQIKQINNKMVKLINHSDPTLSYFKHFIYI